jgi:hypothetical protein
MAAGQSRDIRPEQEQLSCNATRTPSQGKPAAAGGDAPRSHVITFYNDGIFTVDDGPARRIDDPANESFMESIVRVCLQPRHHVPLRPDSMPSLAKHCRCWAYSNDGAASPLQGECPEELDPGPRAPPVRPPSGSRISDQCWRRTPFDILQVIQCMLSPQVTVNLLRKDEPYSEPERPKQ